MNRTTRQTLVSFTAAVLLAPLAALWAAERTDRNVAVAAGAERMHRYNVVWTGPSKDATGVMPIGNGDVAAGVYAIENGDLYLLDTFPGLSLRLIAGDCQQCIENVLKPGVWQHVAVVLDRGIPRVYLDGQPAMSAK
jgi:hypothetical protein